MSLIKSKLNFGRSADKSKRSSGPKSTEEELRNSREFYAHFEGKLMSCLQPSSRVRAQMAIKGITNKVKKHHKYPYEEKDFANFLTKSSEQLGNGTSEALRSMGTAYQQIFDLKGDRDSSLYTDVISPINNGTLKEIGNIQKLRKTYNVAEIELASAEKNKEKVGDPPSLEKRERAVRAKEEARRNLKTAEDDFKRDEDKRLMTLVAMAAIQLEYHKKTVKTFEDLANELNAIHTRHVNNAVGADANMPEIPSTSMYGSENNGNYMTSNSFGFTAIVEKTPPLNPPASTDTKAGGRCQALYDFEAETDDDLPLTTDDIITAVRKVDDQWYYGECNGRQGHFPIDFVKVIDPVN